MMSNDEENFEIEKEFVDMEPFKSEANEEIEVEPLYNKTTKEEQDLNQIYQINILNDHEEGLENYKTFNADLTNHKNRNHTNLICSQRSNEELNKIPLNFNSEDFISGSIKNREADPNISKLSKISNTSLLKELEDKWENIEKEKYSKSKKESRKKLEEVNYGNNGINFSIDNPIYNYNNTPFNLMQPFYAIKTIFSKYHEILFKNRKILETKSEFDNFIREKINFLRKFKNSSSENFPEKTDLTKSGFHKIKNEINLLFSDEVQNVENHGYKSENLSLVYKCNTGLGKKLNNPNNPNNPNKTNNVNSANRSFIKREDDNSYFPTRENLNNQSIDSLVYQSGQDFNKNKTNYVPSKNLISKMQNLFGLIIGEGDESNNQSKLDKSNGIKFSEHREAKEPDTYNSLNSIEKKINNAKMKNLYKSKNEKLNFSNINLDERMLTETSENKNRSSQKMFTFNERCSEKKNIKEKIGENTKTLKLLIETSKTKILPKDIDLNINKKHSSYLIDKCKKEKGVKIYSQNDFGNLINKVNTNRISKIFSWNKEEN